MSAREQQGKRSTGYVRHFRWYQRDHQTRAYTACRPDGSGGTARNMFATSDPTQVTCRLCRSAMERNPLTTELVVKVARAEESHE